MIPLHRVERLALYLRLVRLAWRDGMLDRQERLLLDAAREGLGLAIDEAMRLEARAVRLLTTEDDPQGILLQGPKNNGRFIGPPDPKGGGRPARRPGF